MEFQIAHLTRRKSSLSAGMSFTLTSKPTFKARPSAPPSVAGDEAGSHTQERSRENSQATLRDADVDDLSDVPSLDKLPTNVFLDNFLEQEEEDGRKSNIPSQRKGGAKLTPMADDREDAETALDIAPVDPKKIGFDDTGQTAYTNACRKFKALPCASFHRNLQNSSHINLSNYSLGSKGSMAICIPLVINNKITSVNLSCNDLNKEGITFIGKMMAENDSITELNLSANNLRTHGAKVLSKMLHNNHVIKVLDLSKNSFSSSDAEHLTKTIEEHPTLRCVNLSHNDFGETSAHLFKRMISENGVLQELDLSWCQFRGKGAVEVAKGVRENVGMKKLNLAWNGFAEEGSIAMALALKYCTLVSLDMTNNRVGPEGFGCLIKSLKDSEYLKTLILAKNPIPEDAAILCLEFILSKMDDLKLEELSFEDIIYGHKFKTKQEEVNVKFTNLKISWGYSDMYGKRRLKEYNMVEEAMKAIGKYCQEHDIKIVDLFARFDTDDSMSVSHEEFALGLREAKVPVTQEQIVELIKTLDQDGDGEIDFSEMVLGAELYYKNEDK